MKLIHEALSPDVKTAIAKHRHQEKAKFGMGGCGGGRSNTPPGGPPSTSRCPTPPIVPGCVRPGRTCDVQRVAETLVVQGGQAFEMTIEPNKSPWFQPVGVRATITDLRNTDLSHRVLFTAVEINDVPQEPINVTNPTAPAAAGDRVKGWWSDDWIDPDNYAVPVSWGWISIESQLNLLKIHGIALGLPPATLALVSVSLYGNPASAPPPELTPEQAARPRNAA